MAWTPPAENAIPTPDEVLARLTPQTGEASTGYIGPDDLQYAWEAFLASDYYLKLGQQIVYVQEDAPVNPPVNSIWFETHDDGVTIDAMHVAVATP